MKNRLDKFKVQNLFFSKLFHCSIKPKFHLKNNFKSKFHNFIYNILIIIRNYQKKRLLFIKFLKLLELWISRIILQLCKFSWVYKKILIFLIVNHNLNNHRNYHHHIHNRRNLTF